MGDENTGESTRQDRLVGRRLASYEVLARVARGGMGVVYRARHVYIDKIVALKVLDPSLAERTDLIERFRTEAQSLARVEHDNVVKVIDILEDKGVHFIVMDFAEGVNLRNHVKSNGRMSGEEILSIARQTAEALYSAHRQGILHRDIKPENLIMNSRGRCKLADFGLAGDLRLIAEGHEGPLNFGTPAYSAPEVLRRMVPDKRSDIFSFGATLYFLATGEPPFGQTGAQAIMLRQKQGAELLDSARPDLPEKLNQIIMDCINYHPKNRPGNFNEVLERLPRRIHTRRVGATPATATEPTGPLIHDSGTHELPQSSGLAMQISAGVVAVLAIGLVLFLWLRDTDSPDRNNDTADTNQQPANGTANAPTNTPTNLPSSDDVNDDAGPAFGAEDQAFNAAELDSRAALSNANYAGAWEAWAGFLQDYPNSEYAESARGSQAEVAKRVKELRAQEFEKAVEACNTALRDNDTAEAMAALGRFPPELLEPLNESDEVAVSVKLDTQRQGVLAVEATDLAELLEDADDLRADWEEMRENTEGGEATRMVKAGNLLKERDLLEEFLPGRLADTQEKIGKRLKSLRKVLETEHQAAAAPVEDFRKFNDGTLGEWADLTLREIEGFASELEKRRFGNVLRDANDLVAKIKRMRSELASTIQDRQVSKRVLGSGFVINQVEAYIADLKLAASVEAVLETNLRSIRRSNDVREYRVHAEIEDDGSRSARIDKYSGRVVSVSQGQFVLDDDGQRVTLRTDMLTASAVSRLVHVSDDFDDQLALIAWLVALNRVDEVATEFARLERMENLPVDVLSPAKEFHQEQRLAPKGMHRLEYLAARTGVRPLPASDLDGGLLSRLLDAQSRLESGDETAPQDYLDGVSGIADPELVQLSSFEKAANTAAVTLDALEIWTEFLEPLNAEAWAALAQKLEEKGSRTQARQAAGKALLIDGSNERAWKIWNAR